MRGKLATLQWLVLGTMLLAPGVLPMLARAETPDALKFWELESQAREFHALAKPAEPEPTGWRKYWDYHWKTFSIKGTPRKTGDLLESTTELFKDTSTISTLTHSDISHRLYVFRLALFGIIAWLATAAGRRGQKSALTGFAQFAMVVTLVVGLKIDPAQPPAQRVPLFGEIKPWWNGREFSASPTGRSLLSDDVLSPRLIPLNKSNPLLSQPPPGSLRSPSATQPFWLTPLGTPPKTGLRPTPGSTLSEELRRLNEKNDPILKTLELWRSLEPFRKPIPAVPPPPPPVSEEEKLAELLMEKRAKLSDAR